MNKKKFLADIVLIVLLLCVCAAVFVIIQFIVKKDGAAVLVKVDGQLRYELNLKHNIELEVSGYQGGVNRIRIEDGAVCMTEADCPDALCVKTGWIRKTGETIVCLPHRVVVEITGKNPEADAVVQ